MKDRFAKFAVGEIGYDASRKINRLRIVNTKTNASVYEYGMKNQSPKPKKTEQKDESKQEVKPQKTNVTTSASVPNPNAPSWEGIFKDFIERQGFLVI